MSKFKYPVCIQATDEQIAFLTEELVKLGYKHYGCNPLIFRTTHTWLMTNFGDIRSYFDMNQKPLGTVARSLEEFLALTACVEGDEPHVGEWFVFNNPSNTDPGFLSGNLYKLIKNKFDAEDAFLDGRGRENGYSKHNYRHFKKATKEQIIQHFSKKQNTMNGGMHSDQKGKLIGYKLIRPEYEKQAANIAFKKSGGLYDNFSGIAEGYHISPNSSATKNLDNAGVLNLWFVPVYYEPERFLTVNCDQGQFSVKRTEDGYEFEGKVISLPYLKALRDKMNGYDTVNGWNIAFAHVSIGCKSGISIMELQKLIDQHSQNAF